MTSEQFAGIVRALLSAAGGYVVAQGFIDANTFAAVSGALVTLAVSAWSVWAKRPAA